MPRDATKKMDVRLSSTNLDHLRKIRECGDFKNDSSAMRFCVTFTHTMFRILPAALAESYVKECEAAADVEAPESPDASETPETAEDVPEPYLGFESTTAHYSTTCVTSAMLLKTS